MRAAVLLAALALAAPRPARACATAPPPGVEVAVAEESAIIVWDEASRTEHFVRRASFRTAARDFGFLVPTPNKPELAEVDDEIFTRLEDATRPGVVYERRADGVELGLLCGMMFLMRAKSEAPADLAPVRVLASQRVGGYDATVLEADSATALADWLKERGYANRPALADWLAPYVAKRWKLTAFKIAPKEGETSAHTKAVRMSFPTDRPFYPYREPEDARPTKPAAHAPGDRLLRVFFFGSSRASGAREDGAWPGRATWANRFDRNRVLPLLPVALPDDPWLTVFEDASSPRPGTSDLFFSPAADKSPVIPPPRVATTTWKVPIPLDLLGLVALASVLVVRARRAKSPR